MGPRGVICHEIVKGWCSKAKCCQLSWSIISDSLENTCEIIRWLSNLKHAAAAFTWNFSQCYLYKVLEIKDDYTPSHWQVIWMTSANAFLQFVHSQSRNTKGDASFLL